MRKKEDIELEDIYVADIETTYVECENTSYVWSVRLLCMDGKMERFYDLDSFMERIKKFQSKKKFTSITLNLTAHISLTGYLGTVNIYIMKS